MATPLQGARRMWVVLQRARRFHCSKSRNHTLPHGGWSLLVQLPLVSRHMSWFCRPRRQD